MSILERDTVNAFCRHTHVAMEGAPTGPLGGLTFGLKDIFDVAGHRTGFGTPDWLRTHPPASQSASVLQRLLAAGASMVGKTHTEEMAFSLTGENAFYGTPTNPAAPGRVPGGSSSGSAAAVAAGLVDFAIGSDTGGSVRAPASFCGLFGIRPTHGRIALDGVCPLAPTFDTCGWFARDAAMLRRVGEVLLDWAPGPEQPGRLLVATDGFGHAEPDVAAMVMGLVGTVERRWGSATPVTVSESGLATWFTHFRTLQHADIWRTHQAWIEATNPQFGPMIATRFAAVSHNDAGEVARAAEEQRAIRSQLDALLANRAVLLMPTVPDIAPLLNEPPETAVPIRERALAMLCVSGLGGLPQVNIPAGLVRGCPVGLSLLAARGEDELLLRMAEQIAAQASAHTAQVAN